MITNPYVSRSGRRKAVNVPARAQPPPAPTSVANVVHAGNVEVRGELHALRGLYVGDVHAGAGGGINVHGVAEVVTDSPLRIPAGVATAAIHPIDPTGVRVGGALVASGDATFGADTLTHGTTYVGSVAATPGVGAVSFASPVVFLAGTTGVGLGASGVGFRPAIGPGIALEMRVSDPSTGAGVATASPSSLAGWTDVSTDEPAVDVGLFDGVSLRTYRHATGDPVAPPSVGIAAEDLAAHPLLRAAVVRSVGSDGAVCGYSDHVLVAALVAHNRVLADALRAQDARIRLLEARA